MKNVNKSKQEPVKVAHVEPKSSRSKSKETAKPVKETK